MATWGSATANPVPALAASACRNGEETEGGNECKGESWRITWVCAPLNFITNFMRLEKMKEPEFGHVTLIQLIHGKAKTLPKVIKETPDGR